MESLPSPTVSTTDSTGGSSVATTQQLGRKRARSSLSSEASSSKRAMSEDPSSTAAELPLAKATRNIGSEEDIDAYMREQGGSLEDDATPLPPTSLSTRKLSPMEKFEFIKSLKSSSMIVGEVWYIVSRAWYRRWERACRGEFDKEGKLLESQVGPVDNSMFFDAAGLWDRDKQLIDGVDVEFVPRRAWDLFTMWYGETPHVLARQVIARGIKKEPTLELRPPILQVFRLVTSNSLIVEGLPSKYMSISSQADLAELYVKLLHAFELPLDADFRVWKVGTIDEEGTQYPTSKLVKAGGELLPSRDDNTASKKTFDQLLFAENDGLVIEVSEAGSWLVNGPTVQATETSSQEPIDSVFTDDSDFFSKLTSNTKKSVAKETSANIAGSQFSSPFRSERATNDRKSPIPGTIGFSNMGNTCFMNSALQCLAHTPELVEYFLTGVFEEELNPENPLGMQGAIAETFGALLNRVWKPATSAPYAPREFKMQLQRFAPQFSGYQQHDSQELVAFLLDGLHEDLNRVLKKPYIEKPDWEGGGDKDLVMLAKRSWEGYKKRNDSVIVDLFQGQYRSTLICPECKKVSVTFDPYMYLTLPLPIQKKWVHKIYYIPWDINKPHVKVPIEVDRSGSFKDVRQTLGRWMGASPNNLLILETFNNRFYKELDDLVSVGDMSDTDTIVCFELPCHARQSRLLTSDADSITSPLILPVHLCKELSSRSNLHRPSSGFAPPFVVILDSDQIRGRDRIYAAIIERLERWTQNSRDLYQWEADTVASLSPQVQEFVIEISEGGEMTSVDEPVPDESDIVDQRTALVFDDELGDSDHVLRRLGPKTDLFTVQVQSGHTRYGAGSSLSSQKWERLDIRSTHRDGSGENPVLLFEGDALFCDWDENFRSYFFGEDNRYELACWDEKSWKEYIHPEFKEFQDAQAARKSKGISLHDCLAEFTKEEELGEEDLWYCPRCKKHQQATKRFELWTVPDFLVVHLKRFSNSRILRDKIDAFVDFPMEGLDLEPFCGEREVAKRLGNNEDDARTLDLSDVNEPLIYDLYAVDEHLGGLGGGHYRAYAKNHESDKWYHFDDSYVNEVSASDAVNENAYLLFYKRRSDRPLGGITYEKVKDARRKAASYVEDEYVDAAQLPTPPYEHASVRITDDPQRLKLGSSSTKKMVSQNAWRSSATGVNLSPSPPALDTYSEQVSDAETEDRRLGDAEYDEKIGDANEILTGRPLEFPDPSSRINSPASSIAADVGDDMGELDLSLTPQDSWPSEEQDSPSTSPATHSSVDGKM